MSQREMFQLTEIEQHLLLRIARNAVQAYLSGEVFNPPDGVSGVLTESCGIFVSIHKDGELRGCIGSVTADRPLYCSAAECAVSAAFGDPRFVPLTMDELAVVDFEISVLSPMQRVSDIGEIEVGKHGLLISKRGCRGLLLPQVATAYSWDLDTFLSETCRKAGLKADEWKDGATINRFSAFVFHERSECKPDRAQPSIK